MTIEFDGQNNKLGTTTANSVTIKTNDTDAVTIDSSQNVGVGTSSPDSILHLYSNNSGGTPQSRSALIIEDTEANGDSIQFLSTDTGFQNIFFGDASDNDVGRIAYSHTGDSMRFNTNGSEAMRIDSSGNVLVGKTAIALATVGGELRADGQITGTKSGGSPLILNRTTSDGEIAQFYKDATKVGSISTQGSTLEIGSGDVYLQFNGANDWIKPVDGSGNNKSGVDLGTSGAKFDNLYLGGNIYLGGTGSANALDDYEEGTFTVTNAGDSTGTITQESGEYTKIGRMVYIRIVFDVGTNFSSRSIGGLPFQVNTDLSGGSSWTPMNVLTESSNDSQIIPKFANGTTNIHFDKNYTNNSYHLPNTTNNFYRLSGWYITNS